MAVSIIYLLKHFFISNFVRRFSISHYSSDYFPYFSLCILVYISIGSIIASCHFVLLESAYYKKKYYKGYKDYVDEWLWMDFLFFVFDSAKKQREHYYI